ncbi:MAG TPA: hypothetical protein VK960_04640 [Acidimicrobiia bacterium]|nr:hypothetical protein [Acidimicrobiia bacterium]
MRSRWAGVAAAVLLSGLVLTPVAAHAGERPDGRAEPSFVEGVIDADGQLWLRVGFYQSWGDEPPRDLFSLFWRLTITIGDETSVVGWEIHDGVETYLGGSGTRAYLLDNGDILIATGLFPTGDYEVSIAAEFASWLDEATSSAIAGSTGFGTGSSFIDAGDPFTRFGGAPIWDLATGRRYSATTTSTSTTTAETPSTTTAEAGSTDDTPAGATSADGGGLPLWLFGFAGVIALLVWLFLTGRIPGTRRYAYRVDTPALETMVDETPDD